MNFSIVYTLNNATSSSSILLPTLITLILIVVNGLFVAAEFAIISVRSTQIEQLSRKGNRRAKLVLKILKSPNETNKYIATAQLGITLASLGLGMYAEPNIATIIEPHLFSIMNNSMNVMIVHSIATLITLALLTYLHVVLGEMIPKSLALSNPKSTVLSIMTTMYWTQKLLSIPVSTLNFIGDNMLKALKINPPKDDSRLHSNTELAQLVNESTIDGIFQENEQTLLLGVLSFADQKVSQIMTPRNHLQAIAYDTPLDKIIQQVTQSKYSRFPVYQNNLDNIIGILHIRDLIKQNLLNTNNKFSLRPLLRPAPYIPESAPLTNMMAALKRNRVHMAVAIDEYGGTAGIVTLEDLVEEIVGEVRDEFDSFNEPIVQISSYSFNTSGDCPVSTLLNHIELGPIENLPEVETVSGLIMTWLGRPPKPQDTYTYNENVLFTVLDVEGLTATKIRIQTTKLSTQK